MNNLESVYTYEGTHEVHTLVLGQALTGENAFGSRLTYPAACSAWRRRQTRGITRRIGTPSTGQSAW